jgi:GNAT superfamily N-acetyltransferase
MRLAMRAYTPRDFWRVRAFLRETFLINGRTERNWQCYRWEYWRWHGVANLDEGPMEEKVFLWETPDGELAAVLNAEGRGHAHLQVHPAHRSEELEDEMVDVAEERLWKQIADGRVRVAVWSHTGDALREGVLARRGFEAKPGAAMHDRWMSLTRAVPAPVVPDGYVVRPMGDGAELLERCYTSGLAFHPDEPAIAHENRADVTWYRNIQRAPLYRRDLDIVAVAPDGAVASFATIWFDDVTLTAACEPVATSPVHQKKGLARACIHEGLRRARDMGATMAFVGSGEDAAHRCYESAGFTDYMVSRPWIKEV